MDLRRLSDGHLSAVSGGFRVNIGRLRTLGAAWRRSQRQEAGGRDAADTGR